MAFIFLDESGDLGFNFLKTKTSKYFVISFLFIENKNHLEKIVKRTFRRLRYNNKKHTGILHCYKEHPKTRIKLLSLVNELNDLSIISIYLNKKKVYTKLQDEKHVLYNYVTNILLDRLYTKKLISTKNKVYLIASKRETNKFLNSNFKTYLENQVSKNHHLDLEVLIRNCREEKSLQVVDFISWTIFRMLEHRDKSYYDLIKSKIVEINPLFP